MTTPMVLGILIVVGVLLGVFGEYVEGTIKKLILAVTIILVLLWVLTLFGLSPLQMR